MSDDLATYWRDTVSDDEINEDFLVDLCDRMSARLDELADTITALRAENEASWQREQRLAGNVAGLKAENERLRGLLKDCADDLEAEYAARYPDKMRSQYPSVEQDYQRDMSTVHAARAALEEKGE